MRNTQGKLENIIKELERVRDLARTSLAPDSMNLPRHEWNTYKVDKIGYEIQELIYDLENNLESKEEEE